jgi:hypothetical protein
MAFRHVGFSTSKPTYRTAPDNAHVNYVVLDSGWEADRVRVLESHPSVITCVKNQRLQFQEHAAFHVFLPSPTEAT